MQGCKEGKQTNAMHPMLYDKTKKYALYPQEDDNEGIED